mmetsp:Transcript_60260/g.174529  ORF Transcript_60260/g.174529 Transcript_60260/m.174529 type:complete len:227 (-) Transcript_60260:1196-1876(-)
MRRARGHHPFVELAGVIHGDVPDRARLQQAARKRLEIDFQERAMRQGLRPANVDPLQPEDGLAEPRPRRHGGALLVLYRRRVRVLGVDHLAAHERVRRFRRRARREHLVALLQAHDGDGLRAHTVHQLEVQPRPQLEHRVLQEVGPLDLEAQVAPQGLGQQLQGQHVLLVERLPLGQPELSLLPHRHGNVRLDAVLPQVLAQRAHLHRLVLLHHLVVHHRRRECRD